MTGKPAFTMIEVLFVIVILGILAAVAIPKISALRADAKSSTKAHSIMTAVTEIASYAVAKGNVDSNLSEMSNSISGLVSSGDAVLDITNKKVVISSGAVTNCLSIQILINDTLNITFGNANSDGECMGIQSLINLNAFPVKLGGTRVVY